MQFHICCWFLEVLEASRSILKDKLVYPLSLTLQLLVLTIRDLKLIEVVPMNILKLHLLVQN